MQVAVDGGSTVDVPVAPPPPKLPPAPPPPSVSTVAEVASSTASGVASDEANHPGLQSEPAGAPGGEPYLPPPGPTDAAGGGGGGTSGGGGTTPEVPTGGGGGGGTVDFNPQAGIDTDTGLRQLADAEATGPPAGVGQTWKELVAFMFVGPPAMHTTAQGLIDGSVDTFKFAPRIPIVVPPNPVHL